MPDQTDTATDPSTAAMFADADLGGPPAEYQVLARKYRPSRFEDLIGQDVMVRTLKNAFETGRIAHAFMLTGVRGVGKTTTARLLARALNYESEDHDGPSVRLDPKGEHCDAIMTSRHPDVLELDAASRTGVADMRDLLDGVRFAAASARYKVYIIDEVHMLSTAAFNALLKTLEEPPSHVKFVFATTEIRKVPVTVLSRCQRFDLKRLDTPGLAKHLAWVCEQEGAQVAEAGLAMIARAAEGSVRDALSILDQAIVQGGEGEVSAETVRDMLGLGDRTRLLDLFQDALSGDAKAAALSTADMIQQGADPLTLLKDLLDISADIATAQAVGDSYDPGGPADWTDRVKALAAKISTAQAARCWQLLLSGYRDAQSAPEADTAARMVVVRLAAAAGLPGPEEAARLLNAAASGGAQAGEGAAPAPPGGEGPSSWAEIVALMDARRDAALALQAERHVRPVECAPGRLHAALSEDAPRDLLGRIAAFLEEETGRGWEVSLAEAAGPSETLKERAERLRQERVAGAAGDPAVQALLERFPGAEIVDVRQEAPVEAEPAEDNVVSMRAGGALKGSSR